MTTEESTESQAAAAAAATTAAVGAAAPAVAAIVLLLGRATAKTAALATLALPPSYQSHATHRSCNLPPHGLSNSYPNSTIIIKRLPTSFDDPRYACNSLHPSPYLYEVGRARAHARVIFSDFPEI